MTGMETLHYAFAGGTRLGTFAPVLVGVVASGNLEVLVEPAAADGCTVDIDTSARGFADVWAAVLADFHARHGVGGLAVAIHDLGATPAVVSLRLDQAMAALRAGSGGRP